VHRTILGPVVNISELKSKEEARKHSLAKLKRILGEIVDTFSSINKPIDPSTVSHQHRMSKLASAILKEMHLEEKIEANKPTPLAQTCISTQNATPRLDRRSLLKDAKHSLHILHQRKFVFSYNILSFLRLLITK